MYERILVPLDGSALSETVLSHVEPLAEKFASRLILIRVNAPLGSSPAAASPPQEPAGRHLTRVAEQLRKQGFAVQMELPHGNPAEQILECAGTAKVDLIAMTTHGEGGLGRLLFGSVADAVLRHAPCPVLLVRIDESVARRVKLENVVF